MSKFRPACSSHFRGLKLSKILFWVVVRFLCHFWASYAFFLFGGGGGGDKLPANFGGHLISYF